MNDMKAMADCIGADSLAADNARLIEINEALVEALEYAQDRLDFADAQHMEVLHARIAEALRLAKGES